MFPITDLSRAGDIRMRRRRAVWLLAGIVVVPMVLFSGNDRAPRASHGSGTSDLDVDLRGLRVQSDSVPGTEIESFLRRLPFVGRLDWMVEGAPLPAGRRDGATLAATGTSLTVVLPCAGSITLVPQQDAPGRVFVSTRDTRLRLDGLRLEGGPALALTGACQPGGPDLVVQAPASMPLTLVQTGDTSLRLGMFTGPVRLSQNGSGDVVIDEAGSLDVAKSGNGDLSVGRLSGTLHLTQNGSGDTVINSAEVSRVDAILRGSGDLSIPRGHIGRLDVVLQGSGDLSSAAEIGDASVRASDDADVTLPHVRGRLDRSSLSGATE